MSIAIVTGASSGIGLEFFKSLIERKIELDEIWVVARSYEKLIKLQELTDIPLKAIGLDLSKEDAYYEFADILKHENPSISYLFCGSGFGRFEAIENDDLAILNNMVDLNCKGVLSMTKLCMSYMAKNSQMIVVASVAAMQPIPYIATYAASKAFVLSYGRSLNVELKKQSSRCLTVCPFWTKTNFFDRANSENKIVKKYAVMYEPKDIINRLWKDLKHKKRDVSICGAYTKGQSLLVKLMPHKFVMKVWLKQQKLK